MSLLQDASFLLYNGDKAGFKLALLGEKKIIASEQEFLVGKSKLMLAGGVIIDGKLKAVFSFITSLLNPSDVIVGVSDEQLCSKIPPVYTRRDMDGVLKLVPY